jgi:hypothetical protein
MATNTDDTAVAFKDRTFSETELALVREVVARCAGLSRQELANTVCELLDWRRPGGGLKTWECKEFLADLDARGLLSLPILRAGRPRGARTSVPHTQRGEAQPLLRGVLGDVEPVSLRLVRTGDERLLWRELVGRHHPLGHAVPFGAHLRYLIEVARPTPRVVGCVQVSSPAWRMAPRDRWIGWSDARRRQALQQVVNNSRFLVLPWVEVRYLASSVLAQSAREVPGAWESVYGVRPLLLETLVDASRVGTCYRAANWVELGLTQGRGRMDRHRTRERVPKRVFVYPLTRDARQLLRGEGER